MKSNIIILIMSEQIIKNITSPLQKVKLKTYDICFSVY